MTWAEIRTLRRLAASLHRARAFDAYLEYANAHYAKMWAEGRRLHDL